MEVEPEVIADGPHGRLGVLDQILVVELPITIRSQNLPGSMAPVHSQPPVEGAFGHRGRSFVPFQVGDDHVASVPDQMDKSGLGEQTRDRLHERDVERGLVPVQGLALALGVQPKDDPDRFGESRRPLVFKCGSHLLAGQAETTKVGHRIEITEEPVDVEAPLSLVSCVIRGHGGQKPRLMGNGELRMGVEDHAQKRQARSSAADEDRDDRLHRAHGTRGRIGQ